MIVALSVALEMDDYLYICI